MHRSGTSALTRVLSILGAVLPRHVLGAGPGNETGHWEPEKLVEFHDGMLAELDSAWNDWTALDVARLTAERRDAIKIRLAEIINDEYRGASLMVVKDPRICRFAPLLLEALTDAGITPECVLTIRNPLEVVRSLERRDGMLRGHAGLLWLRHVLDAEAATRGKGRAILLYDDLLSNWRSEVRRIRPEVLSDVTGAAESVAADIDEFLNVEQRHHALSAADVMRDPVTSGWIGDVYSALRQLRQHPASAAAFATLDRVRSEFDRAAPLISAMQCDQRARLQAEMADTKTLAERRVAEAEQRALEAEQRAAEAGRRAVEVERRAAEAEQGAAEAKQRAAELTLIEGGQREAAASLAARLVEARARVDAMVALASAAPNAGSGRSTPPAAPAAPLAEIADVTQWLESVPLQISLAFGNWEQLLRRRLRRRALRFIRALLPKRDTIP